MPSEITTGKTIFILAAVLGCFAILWPRLFSPMLQSTIYQKSSLDDTAGCCDVISDRDVNAIRILTAMCGRIITKHEELDPKILSDFTQGRMNKDVVNTCKREVLNTCGIDITTFLAEQVGLGRTYSQILDNIKSFNNSVCLKQNFGLERGLLGAARHWSHTPLKHIKQERPPHMRPDLINAALRERGRAIPQSNVVPKIIEGRPGPIPGMRPPMGGAGHVVPPPKGTQGALGILMPLYTIGIVMIFVYTMMKLLTRRSSETESASNFQSDPNFRQYVFSDHHGERNGTSKQRYDQPTKLGEIEMLMLRRRLQETEAAMERIVKRVGMVPFKSEFPTQGENGLQTEPKREAEGDHEAASVKVVNMETTASCEGGKPWSGSRPTTPTPRSRPPSRPPTPLEREAATIPPPQDAQEIYLEGALPSQAQLLVAESETEAHKAAPGEVDLENSNDPPVILSGKMTLSLIPDPMAHGSDDEGHTGRDSGQESEQEDGHDSNDLERKANQHGNSTNTTQTELTDQSEQSDHFEDSETFENFDYSVNVKLSLSGPLADNKDIDCVNTCKPDPPSAQKVTITDRPAKSKNCRRRSSKNGIDVEGDEKTDNDESSALEASSLGTTDHILAPEEIDLPQVIQGEKKKKLTFVYFDDKDIDLNEELIRKNSGTMNQEERVELQSAELKSISQPVKYEGNVSGTTSNRLQRLTSLDQKHLQNEIESIIEEAVECVQQELETKQYLDSLELEGGEGYLEDEDEEEELDDGEEEEVDEEEEEDIEEEEEEDDDIGKDVRIAIKESEKIRKAVHDKVEEVNSSMSSVLSEERDNSSFSQRNTGPDTTQSKIQFDDKANKREVNVVKLPDKAEEISEEDVDEEMEEEELDEEELEEEELEEEELEDEEVEEEVTDEDEVQQRELGGNNSFECKGNSAVNNVAVDHEVEYEDDEEEVDEEEELEEEEEEQDEETEEEAHVERENMK